MKFKRIVLLSAFILVLSCKKSEPAPIVPLEVKHKISGIVTTPGGTPLSGVLVTFDDGTNLREVLTNASGQYQFAEYGNSPIDLFFDGNPLWFLNMRNRNVEFGDFDRTYDKMMVPWEIEEMDFLSAPFVDNPDKKFSLVHYGFDELKIKPSDFKNLVGTDYLKDYETTFTSVQSDEEVDITVSFYSMPNGTGYTLENNHTITYADVLTWQKVLSITTTTTPIGVLEPVKVNLAAAYANYADYDHSGTIVMVSEEINETLGVTYEVDVLEIQLPYGDDFEFQY